MNEVYKKVLEDMKAMSDEEFLSELEKYRDDPLVLILTELGFGNEQFDQSKSLQ